MKIILTYTTIQVLFSNLYISVTFLMLEFLQSYLSKDSLININCSWPIFTGEVLKLGSRQNVYGTYR